MGKHKKKTLPKKPGKKEKDEEVNKEPVEVVIHVKKPKNKVIRSDNKTTGVVSGKIGKRKATGKPSEMKKKLLRKLSGKMEEKLESVVNTILEVAVVAKKVVPKAKACGAGDVIKTKEKFKKDKKKIKVKEEIKKVEIKEEKKELKENKDLKEVKEVKVKKEVEKKPTKEIRKEIKVEKKDIQELKDEKKEDKEVKKEVVEVPEEKKVKIEVIEEIREPKEEKKPKETKPKSKKPKKVNEDCVNKVEGKNEDPTSSKNQEAVKSPTSKELIIVEPTTPKSPADLLVKKKVRLKDDEPKKEVEPEKANEQKKTKSASKTPSKKKKEKPVEVKKETELNLDESKRRMKLFGFWEGPKRHREASLNALAKVHCLYENESRGAMMEMFNKAVIKSRPEKKKSPDTIVIKEEEIEATESAGNETSAKESEVEEIPKRNLRSAPGMRSVGRCWDVEPLSSTTSPSFSSSSSDEASDVDKKKKALPPQPAKPKEKSPVETPSEDDTKKKEEPPVKKVRKRRKRCELMMDLKDMVVRKRMASLNASAMLAASYSMEKRSVRSGDDERRRRGGNRSSSDDSTSTSMDVESSDDEVIVSGSSKKVAVIVNQDTDVTITGLYVNSTTRSTRHCSITGMQYRISSTSHTQTESTAVTTETVIHTSDHVSVSHCVSTLVSSLLFVLLGFFPEVTVLRSCKFKKSFFFILNWSISIADFIPYRHVYSC